METTGQGLQAVRAVRVHQEDCSPFLQIQTATHLVPPDWGRGCGCACHWPRPWLPAAEPLASHSSLSSAYGEEADAPRPSPLQPLWRGDTVLLWGFPFQRPRGSGSGARGPDAPAMTRWVLGGGVSSAPGPGVWSPPLPPASPHMLPPPAPRSPGSSTTARGTVAPAPHPTAARSSPRPMRRMCASFTKVRWVLPAAPLLPVQGGSCTSLSPALRAQALG